jgi:hypothetical protein
MTENTGFGEQATDTVSRMFRYPQLSIYILHPLLLEGVRRSRICNCKTENRSFVGTLYGARVLWAPYMGHVFCGHPVRGTCFVGTLYGARVLWAPVRGTCFVGTLYRARVSWAPDTDHIFSVNCSHAIRKIPLRFELTCILLKHIFRNKRHVSFHESIPNGITCLSHTLFQL